MSKCLQHDYSVSDYYDDGLYIHIPPCSCSYERILEREEREEFVKNLWKEKKKNLNIFKNKLKKMNMMGRFK